MDFRLRFIASLCLATLFSLFLLLSSPNLLVAQENDKQPNKGEAENEVELKQADSEVVPKIIREAMQNRDYPAAITAIDKAMADDAAAADYLLYLKGRAFFFDGNFEQSIKTFELMVKQFPESDWARKARFAKGVAYARSGDYRSAELTYKQEAEFLLSMERKEEVCAIYLDFADSFFAPDEKTEAKPRFDQALSFYEKALEVGPKPNTAKRVELQIARCKKELNKAGDAIKLYQKFLKDHKNDALTLPARFELAELYLKQGNRIEARRHWEDILSIHADAQSPLVALAAFRLPETLGLPSAGDKESLARGIALYEKFLKSYPKHEKRSLASYNIALGYFNFNRTEEAIEQLDQFIANQENSESEQLPMARYLLGQAYLNQMKFDLAIDSWREYLSKHPTHGRWSEAQQAIINAEFNQANTAYQKKQYEEARKLWQQFLVKYPVDSRSAQIHLRLGSIQFNEKKWEKAIEAFRLVVTKFPKTNESSVAQFLIGSIYETEIKDLPEAIEQYKKINWGSHASRAKQRIELLSKNQLVVSTPRIFRSDETPKVMLKTRNLHCVTVKVYSVDLETYFRKMHLATGVEGLDIALIDPDSSFEYAIEDYEKYRQFTSEVEVPLPSLVDGKERNSGVMAVTVSTEKLETTTLVVQSDLDMIVKSSRDEVFVFAQNMRTGKPWEGAELLISNGSEVFAEAKTNKQGIYHASRKELSSPSDIRVFGISNNHVASNVVSLSGLSVSQGLQKKGYLFTDRSTYQPGQWVNLKGIVRTVSQDSYEVPQDKQYELEVFDPRGRLVFDKKVKLNDFGAFHSNFQLPREVPQGQFRTILKQKKDQTYTGTFTVQRYQLPNVFAKIETEKSVYYRGEKITGTITANYYHGAPLTNTEVIYRLENGRNITTKTNDKGEIEFEFETRDFQYTQPLNLVVSLPSHNVNQVKRILLASQEFTINASTIRDVYLSGETLEVEAFLKDMEGETMDQAAELKLYRLLETPDADGNSEKLISSEKVEFVKDQSSLKKAIMIEEGGRYAIRLSATDRFDNQINGQTVVTISDKSDDIRLRILADQLSYKVGETAKVNVHWREKPALALITYQGAKILDHKLVKLKQGENQLEIPLVAKLAPNFQLAVSLMTDVREINPEKPIRRFHEATTAMQVERDLRINIFLPKKTTSPGEKVAVKILTRDPSGVPVSADVSLAMVEKSLLDRFPEKVPAIQKFFQGNVRKFAIKTTSSITFSYNPSTRGINALLLAERERVLTERLEEERLAEFGDENIVMNDFIAPEEDFDSSENGDPFGESRRYAGARNRIEDLSYAVPNAPADMPQLAKPGSGGFGGANQRDFLNGAQQLQSLQRQVQASNSRGSINLEGQIDALYSMQRFDISGVDERRARLGINGNSFGYDGTIMLNNNGDSTHWGMNYDENTWFNINNSNEIQVISGSGEFYNYNFETELGDQWTLEDAGKVLNQLAEKGNMIMPGLQLHETGFWDPQITTDAKGEANLEITIPDRSTAWKLTAKGITKDSNAGEAEADLVVKKELFGEIKLASAFIDGDQVQIPVTIHSSLEKGAKVKVQFRYLIGDKQQIESKEVEFKKAGIQEVVFSVDLKLPADQKEISSPESLVIFHLQLETEKLKSSLIRSVPLLPAGLPVYAVEGGTSSGDATAVIQRPKTMPWSHPQLEIVIGPSVHQSLFDVIFASPIRCQRDYQRHASAVDNTTSNLLSALALQRLISKSREGDHPQSQAIDQTIRTQIRLLVSMQKDDGSWTWGGTNNEGNAYTSSRTLWALQEAIKSGYKIDNNLIQRAITYLKGKVVNAAVNDFDTKATLLHALTTAGQEDFSLANQLYRNRNSLSSSGLSYLSLTYLLMNRTEIARELTTLIEQKLSSGEALPSNMWSSSEIETQALYALCLANLAPNEKQAKEKARWLMSNRTGYRWAPEKATGPAMLAVCLVEQGKQLAAEKYTLTIFVNDKELKKLELDTDQTTQSLSVPTELLGKEKDTVRIQINGRAEYTYQCVMSGFVAYDKLKSTTKNWDARRKYTPAPLEIDGKPVPSGFNVVSGNYSTFSNPLNQLPIAKRGHVELSIWRNNYNRSNKNLQWEYLVVTEPIPAGAAIDERTIRGSFDRYELSPGSITFYIGGKRSIGSIHYDLVGSLAGDFKIGPTVIRDAYQLDQIAVTTTHKVKVLPYGQKSSDKYRLTPRELYEIGKIHFDKQDFAKSKEHLTELFSNWALRTEYFKPTISMLMDIHLTEENAADAVKYFEIVIDKYPELEIPFAKLMDIAKSYHEIGEYERAHLVYRATIEANFMVESQVAGFLRNSNEFLRSVEVMSALLKNSPPEPYVATANYALAQQIFAKAPQATTDEKLKAKKMDRITLVRRSLSMLESFLTANPEDPSADQAAFSLATGLLELDGFHAAIKACSQYSDRYEKSKYRSSYWYIIGFCHFALGQHEQALQYCEKVAQYQANQANLASISNESVTEQNKWRAIYIMGQIYHSLGEAAKAISEYERVKQKFVDAAQSIDFFKHKEISLPEITTFNVNQENKKIEIKLNYRNVKECDIHVYRIDLMKFSLLQRNLDNITSINLAGIRPYHEEVIDLSDGKPYADQVKMVNLPIKEEGAYLVVCRGDSLHTSGLALLTPLEVKIQENINSGRVRVTIKDSTKDQYLTDVHVKVIGTANQQFNSGESDLRGVFIADNIRGKTTVIAEAEGGQYAFYRGKLDLQYADSKNSPEPPASEEKAKKSNRDSNELNQRRELLRGIQDGNSAIQVEQQENLKRYYDNGQGKGIKNFKF